MATIVLVEPQHPGNVGAVARVMSNFGCDELVLVGGCEIDDDAKARAKAGRPLLETARRAASLKKALAEAPVSVATSGIVPEGDNRWQRAPHPIQELAELLDGRQPALVFGRENHGLDRGELALCDLTIQVPTNPEHPVLNLSHAVGIVLYELFRTTFFCAPTDPTSSNGRKLTCWLNALWRLSVRAASLNGGCHAPRRRYAVCWCVAKLMSGTMRR